MAWSPQSPDLNLIELDWDELGKKSRKLVNKHWNKPSKQYLMSLVEIMH